MKSQILVYLLFAFSNLSIAQTISLKIDTSDTKNREYLFFIESFMNDTVVDNPLFWHPKYRDLKVKNINHGFDWIWRTMSPKQINTFYHTQVMELQHINDTLSYFKILISNNDTSSISMYNVYKYYIVNKNGKLFLENCLPVERDFIFNRIDTKNIRFYVSKFYEPISEIEFKKASQLIDSLRTTFKIQAPQNVIDYYMCRNEEEMNLLSNIVVWNGGGGGYASYDHNFVIGLNNNPAFTHEFIHVILSRGSHFVLIEGIAVLFGDFTDGSNFEENGKRMLRTCYENKACTFEDLSQGKQFNNYNRDESYTFAALVCSYILDNFGMDFFLKLYYDNGITSDNFFSELSARTGRDMKTIQADIEKLIKN